MMNESLYARQSDLEKLTVQVEKFVGAIHELVTAKALHEVMQDNISQQLYEIKHLIKENNETVEKRLKKLENADLIRIDRVKTLRKYTYALGTLLVGLSSLHWREIGHFIYSIFN